MLEKLFDAWCRYMHTRTMWPAHGRYTCSECHREYPVPWETPSRGIAVMPHRQRPAESPRLVA
jgi:hypothetical protein